MDLDEVLDELEPYADPAALADFEANWVNLEPNDLNVDRERVFRRPLATTDDRFMVVGFSFGVAQTDWECVWREVTGPMTRDEMMTRYG